MACVYMAESVKALPKETQALIDVQEWDMRSIEGNRRFRELRSPKLPSLALDGDLIFEAIIPGQEELIEEITKRYRAKSAND